MGYLASVLKVGPVMHNLFGYEIVVSKTFAFFAMERCEDCVINESMERSML